MDNIQKKLVQNLKLSENLEKIAIFENKNVNDFLTQGTIASRIIKIVLSRILSISLFFFIFSFFKVIKKYMFKFTKIVKKLPIIGILDGFFGALCGILKAFIFLFIFAIICYVLIILTNDESFLFNNKIINSTYLFFLFYKITYFLK